MPIAHQALAFASIDDTARLIRERELSPVELTKLLLERIEALNPMLNAFVTVTEESALAQARQAEDDMARGLYRGPLHGIPIVHKDIYYTRAIRTTASSKILRDFIPDYDATTVMKLEQAGMITLGKVQTHEFAAGGSTGSPHFGPCRNPWDITRVPGGSSGGSGACVAAGLAFMGTGTDTAGSIRIPAACCGVVGLKPTYGRVSKHGIFPLSWSLDHAGPITRTVRDAALVLQAMAGRDPFDPGSAAMAVPDFTEGLRLDLKGVRVGIPDAFFFDNLESDVRAAVMEAIASLEALGAEAVPVSLPLIGHAIEACWAIASPEMYAIHEPWIDSRPEDYGPDVLAGLESGRQVSAAQYLRAHRARPLIRRSFLDAMANVDVLVTPTLPITAPPIGSEDVSRLVAFTFPFNLTGFPVLSLPCGFSADGLPIGLQLVGKPFRESELLGIGHAYERSTAWHARIPAIA